MDYKKCLEQFNEAKNEYKDLLRQQRFSFVAKHLKEFDMANVRKIDAIKWDWNPLWHIVSNDKCLLATKRPKLPWLHSFEEVEIIVGNLLWRKKPFKSVPWEVQLVKVFFWHSFNKDVSCAYTLQGTSNASIKKMKIGEYHSTW